MYGNSSAALSGEAEPGLAAMPPGNSVHRGNNLLPNRSNTMTAQAVEAEPGQALVALPQVAAGLLP